MTKWVFLLGRVYVQLLTYKAAFLKNSLSWVTCLHASSSTKNDWSWRRLTTTTKKNERAPWLTTTIKKTDHEERLTTTTGHDMTLHHFDLWGRVRVQLLTYESMIMCSFEHNFPLVYPMQRVYKIVSIARRDDVQVFTKNTRLCTSLNYVDTSTCNFWHVRTCLSGKFPLLCPLRTDYEVCSL